MRKYILEGHTPVPCDNLMKWDEWMEGSPRHVAKSYVGRYYISTVFLGLDHNFYEGPPHLFETMVFKKDLNGQTDFNDLWMRRYSTWEEAEVGHQEAIKWVDAGAELQPNLDNVSDGAPWYADGDKEQPCDE